MDRHARWHWITVAGKFKIVVFPWRFVACSGWRFFDMRCLKKLCSWKMIANCCNLFFTRRKPICIYMHPKHGSRSRPAPLSVFCEKSRNIPNIWPIIGHSDSRKRVCCSLLFFRMLRVKEIGPEIFCCMSTGIDRMKTACLFHAI